RHFLAELNFLMESGNWKDADLNTASLIILLGMTEEGFGRNNLSCRDLGTIDRLWVERSEGKFGFSVQKSILDRFASQPGHYNEGVNLEGFYEKIGWGEEGNGVGDRRGRRYEGRSREGVLSDPQGIRYWEEHGVFNLQKAERGHLPVSVWLGLVRPFVQGAGWWHVDGVFGRLIAQRLVECNIQAFQPSIKIP
ncbi:MAG: hypothetical protein F6K28_28570, partial [Microcoleus sp. SIO2G3]|nr:hypothetical protein [Microcoleus sp. SIO2G3]